MLVLHIETRTAAVRALGPAQYFRIEGGDLLQGPDDGRRASYQNGMWMIEDGFFVTCVADVPVFLTFRSAGELAGERLGPFERLRIVDGALRSAANNGALIAQYNERGKVWDLNGRHFSSVTLEPSAPGQAVSAATTPP